MPALAHLGPQLVPFAAAGLSALNLLIASVALPESLSPELRRSTASRGGSWIEFKVIRADVHGRFRASYRFRLGGPARYQFRVLSEAESDYPFAAGSSNVIVVRER